MTFSKLTNTTIGSISLGKLLSAAVALLICLIVIRILVRLTNRLLKKSKLDPQVQNYAIKGLKLLAYIITAIIVVDSSGIPSSSLVALLSVGSLGVTLAAEDILGNLAGGLVILTSRPFAIGDYIETSGTSGTVREITLNHTKLLTPDGLTVMLPNKTLSTSQMTNYTSLGRRRVSQKVGVSYDAPTETVKQACLRAVEMTDKILDDPAPSVYLTAYGKSAIEYTVYCWAAAVDHWDAQIRLGEHLREAFAEYGVEIPYDHLNVHIVERIG